MDNHFIPFSGEEIGIVPLNYSVAFITNAVCGLPPGAPFITRGLYIYLKLNSEIVLSGH